MTMVPNDPTWWPTINAYRFSSYFVVAAFVGVTYDWALTFGQEVELVWRQHWSLMTVLYLGVRYLGILYAALSTLSGVPTISLTDAVSWIVYVICTWTGGLIFVMLWVIIITRLHAMYQRSRKILIFLIVTFLAINTFDGVSTVIATMHKEFILLDGYQCSIDFAKVTPPLVSIVWILSIVWEVIALCLTVWIAVKHSRELQQHSAGGIIGDCFMMLMKTHVVYSAGVLVVSCFQLIVNFSPTLIRDLNSLEFQTFFGLVHILEVVEMSVLGPRLILGVREYHANLVANSDAVTGMTSIAFQEHVHISTGSGV